MADHSTTENEKGLMEVGAAFVADAQAAELMQPTERAFNDPAGLTQAAAVGLADTPHLIRDTQALRPAVKRGIAISAVVLHDRGTLGRVELAQQLLMELLHAPAFYQSR